jgi:hypothetical protein
VVEVSGHTWIQTEDDAGLGGLYHHWDCSVCGACGGVWDRPIQPWIGGHDKKLSEDCQEAQAEMRAYAEEGIARLRAKWNASTEEHRHYASLFHDALRCTPDKTNILHVIDLISKVEQPGRYVRLGDKRRMSLHEVHKSLVEAGFEVVPRALANAVLELAKLGDR